MVTKGITLNIGGMEIEASDLGDDGFESTCISLSNELKERLNAVECSAIADNDNEDFPNRIDRAEELAGVAESFLRLFGRIPAEVEAVLLERLSWLTNLG